MNIKQKKSVLCSNVDRNAMQSATKHFCIEMVSVLVGITKEKLT